VHLGTIGQGPYAAANAELDAIASALRGRGVPALSVAWGPWPGAGMAVAVDARGTNGWRDRGLGWVVPARGFAQMARLLSDGAAHALICPIDWEQFMARVPDGLDGTFFRAVAPAAHATSVSAPGAHSGPALVEQWRRAPSSQWRELLQSHVTERVRQVLGVAPTHAIDPLMALKDAGLDSLMAVELRNVLARSFGRPLPATLLFDFPSLEALSAYLLVALALVPDVAGARATSRAAGAAAADDDLAALSEADAEAQLMAELQAGRGPARP
jgi:acyl carrier protein